MSKTLKLNRAIGKYELAFTVQVDADIFRQMLFNYCKSENIDVTDLQVMQKAIDHCSTFAMWSNHPHASILLQKNETQEREQEQKIVAVKRPPQKSWHMRMSNSHMQELREIALQTPVDEWDNLLTPTPEGGYKDKDVKRVYRLRYDEKMLLAQLKQELTVEPERLELVASSVNGARIK